MRSAIARVCGILASVAFGVLLGLTLAEGVLRLRGERPRRQFRAADPAMPITTRPDPVLGWVSRPGTYDVPPFSPRGRRTHITVLADGSRATASRPASGGGSLLLLGGSFTFGWAVSDEDTFAWRLAQLLPGSEVRNYGVNGYGTFQSLLMLERLVGEGARPSRVLYGFIEQHEMRNIAHPLWLLALTVKRHATVTLPYALLDDAGRLRRMPPLTVPNSPLAERSALFRFLERRYVLTTGRARTDPALAIAVTDRVLAEMAAFCSAHGITFDVILLHMPGGRTKHYGDFLKTLGVPAIDCSSPLTKKDRVPGDSHPNPTLHAKYAGCIARGLATAGSRPAVNP